MENLGGFAQSVLSNLAAQIVYISLTATCLAIWASIRSRLKMIAIQTPAFPTDQAPAFSTGVNAGKIGSIIVALPFWLVLALIYGIFSSPLFIFLGILISPMIFGWNESIGIISGSIVSIAIALGVFGWRSLMSRRPLLRLTRFFLEGLMLAFLVLISFIIFVLVGSSGSATNAKFTAIICGVLFYVAVARIYFTEGIFPSRRFAEQLME